MPERFDSHLVRRAIKAAEKISPKQLHRMQSMIQNGCSWLELETVYEADTKHLVEPVILRYWIQTGKIKTSPVIKVGDPK